MKFELIEKAYTEKVGELITEGYVIDFLGFGSSARSLVLTKDEKSARIKVDFDTVWIGSILCNLENIKTEYFVNDEYACTGTDTFCNFRKLDGDWFEYSPAVDAINEYLDYVDGDITCVDGIYTLHILGGDETILGNNGLDFIRSIEDIAIETMAELEKELLNEL